MRRSETFLLNRDRSTQEAAVAPGMIQITPERAGEIEHLSLEVT